MKNLFKKRQAREDQKSEGKKGVFNLQKENPETEPTIDLKPKGEFLETDEDLGYC